MEPKMLNWIPVGLTTATQHNHCNDVISLSTHWFTLGQSETVNRDQPRFPVRQVTINMPYHKLHCGTGDGQNFHWGRGPRVPFPFNRLSS